MKKLLLSIATLFLASGVFAQDELMEFTDCFSATFNGNPVAENSTISADDFEDVSDLYGENTVTYSINIDIENLDIMPQYIRGTLKPYQPNMTEYQANRFYWGEVQLCYSSSSAGNCLTGDPDNPLNPTFGAGNCEVPVSSVGSFQWNIHVSGCDKNAAAKYILTMQAVYVDDPTGVTYTPLSYPFNVMLDFSAAAAGVDAIGTDNQQGEYYDLQGRRVDNPAKGIYIYKTAGKAVKKIVK